MKSYTKKKSFLLDIVVVTFIAPFISTGSEMNDEVTIPLIWLGIVILIVFFHYRVYKINISNKEINIFSIFKRNKKIQLSHVSLVKFEGFILRDRWLIMSIYDGSKEVASADIARFNSKALIQQIVRNASLNSYRIELDDSAKHLMSEMDEK